MAYTLIALFLSFNFSFGDSNLRSIPGDINDDGIIDVLDIILLVDIIIDNSDYISNGDLNGDGIIDIVDVISIINIIINSNTDPPNENAFGSSQSFDILTWNIENFPKHSATVDSLVSIVEALEIDIIALQEIENTESLNQVRDNLGENWIAYRSDLGSDYGELSYLINTDEVEINQSAYTILSAYDYEFAWRRPYLLNVTHNNTNYIIINIHYKCCGGSENENRRLDASTALEGYISNYFNGDNVILLGDFNDLLVDNPNVFQPFFDEPDNYYFTDIEIATGPSMYWSYPSWPSHLDHILITNELFDYSYDIQTLLLEEVFFTNPNHYEYIISDHRPVGIRIQN